MSSAALLTQAVTSGNVQAVSTALANGADVDERNAGGQTAIILAVIFGHTNLVRLLVNAGADPRLRDNLGLDAIEWAQRRGLTEALEILNTGTSAPPAPVRAIRVEEPLPSEPRMDTDEKSRKWLAGIKQRIQEQARKEIIEIKEPEPQPEPAPVPEPEPVAVAAAPVKTSSPRNRTDEPIFTPPQQQSSTNTPLLLTIIVVTVAIAAFTGYMITSRLTNVVVPDTPTAATQQQPRSFLTGTPVAGGELAGKSVQLPKAECPVFENDSRPARVSQTVNVHIKIDKSGKSLLGPR